MASPKTKSKENNNAPQAAPYILGAAVLIILGIIGLTLWPQITGGGSSNTFVIPPAVLNQPAPPLTLTDLDGNQVSLGDFKGEVVLVNNWATWCPPCRAEMPELNEYYLKYRDQGFNILAVEAGGSRSEVQSFVDQLGLEFTVLLDPGNLALQTFQNASLPNTYVIGRGGNLRLMWTGAINLDTLDEHVTPLIKE